jgi:hypothetical protein
MDDRIDPDLVTDLARDLVIQVAPNELPVFNAVSKAFFASGGKVASKPKDETLGFGLEFAMLTPYILSALGAVVSYVVNEVLSSAKEEASGVISSRIKKLFSKDKPAEEAGVEPFSLSQEQASRAHKLAQERAESLGLETEQAKFLADAIIGSLVVT